MKLKRWLILSHLAVILAPILTGMLLFQFINNYNKNTELKDYLITISKFRSYEEKLMDTELYTVKLVQGKSFIEAKDEGKVKIELYNTEGRQIYSSDNNLIFNVQKEEMYSNLFKVEEGYKAYTLKKPVFKENSLLGIYKITIAKDGFVEEINKRTIIAVISFIFVLIAIFSIVVLLLNRKFNRPIKVLVDGMKSFAKGQKDSVEYGYKDEIGELISQFNLMKQEIEEKRKIIEMEQKTKEYMISAISHDLKTPLTSIRAYAESLTNEEVLDSLTVKGKAEVILNKSDFMKKMIDDLMTFNILTTEQKMDFVEVEGEELFEMLFSGYQESCKQKDIELSTDIKVCGLYSVDVNQITRVVDNIMTNALRYTSKEGHIFMGAFSCGENLPAWIDKSFIEEIKGWKDEGCLIFIKNEGDSIVKEDLDKIFIPFYQSDDSRNKSRKSGVGLGLSIVKLIMEKHKGEARVFSDLGSTIFVCWLPKEK
jgi:signal transduction histidine kinase